MGFRKWSRAALACFLATAAMANSAQAVVVTWTNVGTGNWNDAANWDLGIPGNDDAQINNGGTAIIDDTQIVTTGFATMGVTTGSSGTLKMTGGKITTNFDIRIGGNSTTGGGTGVFEQTGGTVFMNGGNFNTGQGNTSSGTYNMKGGLLTLSSGTIFTVGNRGTGTINQTGGTIYVRGGSAPLTAMVQLGRNAAAGIGSGTYNLSAGSLTVANVKFGQAVGVATSTNIFNLSGAGTLLTTAVSVPNTAATNTFNFTGGTLTANSFALPLANNGGTLSPGTADFSANATDISLIPFNPIGTMTLTGANPYSQGPTGTLAIDLAGVGSNDLVDVGAGASVASATLAGTIAVNLLNGFDPALGDTFSILYADSIVNTATVTGLTPSGNGFQASVVATAAPDGRDVLRLTVVPAPEPSAIALAACAALSLGFRRSRRSR
jgi:hypothetical protein